MGCKPATGLEIHLQLEVLKPALHVATSQGKMEIFEANKMSVTFGSSSQASVTSKHVPVISLLSEEESDGHVQRSGAAKTVNVGVAGASTSLKRKGTKYEPFDPRAEAYYKELMEIVPSNKRTIVAETDLMNKRAGKEKCVPVVVLETSDESSG